MLVLEQDGRKVARGQAERASGIVQLQVELVVDLRNGLGPDVHRGKVVHRLSDALGFAGQRQVVGSSEVDPDGAFEAVDPRGVGLLALGLGGTQPVHQQSLGRAQLDGALEDLVPIRVGRVHDLDDSDRTLSVDVGGVDELVVGPTDVPEPDQVILVRADDEGLEVLEVEAQTQGASDRAIDLVHRESVRVEPVGTRLDGGSFETSPRRMGEAHARDLGERAGDRGQRHVRGAGRFEHEGSHERAGFDVETDVRVRGRVPTARVIANDAGALLRDLIADCRDRGPHGSMPGIDDEAPFEVAAVQGRGDVVDTWDLEQVSIHSGDLALSVPLDEDAFHGRESTDVNLDHGRGRVRSGLGAATGQRRGEYQQRGQQQAGREPEAMGHRMGERREPQLFTGASEDSSLTSCFATSGPSVSMNTIVRIGMPKTLKLVHMSVETVRHSTSFRPARNPNQSTRRAVILRQPSSVIAIASPSTALT